MSPCCGHGSDLSLSGWPSAGWLPSWAQGGCHCSWATASSSTHRREGLSHKCQAETRTVMQVGSPRGSGNATCSVAQNGAAGTHRLDRVSWADRPMVGPWAPEREGADSPTRSEAMGVGRMWPSPGGGHVSLLHLQYRCCHCLGWSLASPRPSAVSRKRLNRSRSFLSLYAHRHCFIQHHRSQS